MSDRYDFDNNTKYATEKGRVYTSIYYPRIPLSDSDIYIIAKQTDRLDLLAYQYYGDVSNWWIIAHANKINGTFFVTPGIQLRIPMDISNLQALTTDINNNTQK